MKKLHLKFLMIILLSCYFPLLSLAQSRDTVWSIHGNHIDSCGRIGSNNYKDVKIVSDSITRVLISKDGYIQIQNDLLVPNGSISTDTIIGVEGGDVNVITNLNVTGYIKADSVISTSGNIGLNGNLNLPNNWIHADSMRCRVIHIGDSSITVGAGGSNIIQSSATVQPLTLISGSTANPFTMQASNGQMVIGKPGAIFSNILVGIGTQNPIASLHVVSNSGTCYGQFSHGSGTGGPATNGLIVGIDGSNNAVINQTNNLPMNLFTHDLQRMTIMQNGSVGIGEVPYVNSSGVEPC